MASGQQAIQSRYTWNMMTLLTIAIVLLVLLFTTKSYLYFFISVAVVSLGFYIQAGTWKYLPQ